MEKAIIAPRMAQKVRLWLRFGEDGLKCGRHVVGPVTVAEATELNDPTLAGKKVFGGGAFIAPVKDSLSWLRILVPQIKLNVYK